MWTIMWTENSQDRWDRLETKEEVMQLLDSLDKNSGVSKGDVWTYCFTNFDFLLFCRIYFRLEALQQFSHPFL